MIWKKGWWIMDTKVAVTKIMAIAGTVCVWFAVLAPFLFSAARLIVDHIFRFDFLMPAELFPAAVAGGALLLWAALRSKKRRGLIGGGFGGAVLLLVGGQEIAVLTGLASGETEPAGGWWLLVVGMLVAYWLALVITGVGGVLLLRDLFKPAPLGAEKG
jgi:hypothetical protein